MLSKDPGFCDPELFIMSPTEGLSTRLRDRHVRRHHPRPAGDPVADLAVHRAGAARQGEAVRDPVRALVGGAVPAGGALAYLTVAQALEFLISWAGNDVDQVFSVSSYVSLVGLMIFAFGIGFLLPVLLVFLQLVGAVTAGDAAEAWRYALVGIVVIAAVITPSGDPVSLMLLGGPDDGALLRGRAHRLARAAAPVARDVTDRRADVAERPDRVELTARYDFPLDRFQSEAFDALDAGEHVVVAAPTGSGKTVVAEYGIAVARAEGKRAFYTAPIKALSNQKYRDLVAIHGDDAVGLLTGDNAINGDAPIVVMTTEVLRNMIYARSRAIDDLALVVLDEVHFLQDTYRGPVWEEVIIHLPQHVRLVCLSATVSNVAELAEWITTVRGPTACRRRAPATGASSTTSTWSMDRTHDRLQMLPDVHRRPAEPRRPATRRCREPSGRRRGRRGRRSDREAEAGGAQLGPPGRVETVELLHARSMLPAIFFIFSRAQCDAAAQGLRRRRGAADRRRRARRDPADRRRPARRHRRRRPQRCSATPSSSPNSRPASPPTTPAWCRRSRRSSRSASSTVW